MVEECAAGRTRRLREIADQTSDNTGTWAYYLRRLKKTGISDTQIAELLPTVRVEPVLTAHPTESKRPAVLAQHRALNILLESIDAPDQSPIEAARLRESLTVALERLWRSGEILLEKPEIASERTGILFHLRDIFPRAVALLDQAFSEAWAGSGFDSQLIASHSVWPRPRFGTWVGGDRDGHPFVTAAVTNETLIELRSERLSRARPRTPRSRLRAATLDVRPTCASRPRGQTRRIGQPGRSPPRRRDPAPASG